MKDLTKIFDNFATLDKYGRDKNSLEELKRDRIIFDTERRIDTEKKNAGESVFLIWLMGCHNYNKIGHIAKFFLSNNNRKPHNTQTSTSQVVQ